MPDPLTTLVQAALQGQNLRSVQEQWETPTAQLLTRTNPRLQRETLADPDLPLPPPAPSGFQPDVYTNNPAVGRLLYEIARRIPAVRGTLGSQVILGPTEGTMAALQGTKYTPYDYARLNLLGTTSHRTGDISLNPRLAGVDSAELLATLIHELTHSAGQREAVAERIGSLFEPSAARYSQKALRP